MRVLFAFLWVQSFRIIARMADSKKHRRMPEVCVRLSCGRVEVSLGTKLLFMVMKYFRNNPIEPSSYNRNEKNRLCFFFFFNIAALKNISSSIE